MSKDEESLHRARINPARCYQSIHPFAVQEFSDLLVQFRVLRCYNSKIMALILFMAASRNSLSMLTFCHSSYEADQLWQTDHSVSGPKGVLYENLLLQTVTMEDCKAQKAEVDVEFSGSKQVRVGLCAQTAQTQMDAET